MIAAALCMSFFPKGLARIGLLTLLFPLFSLALCAWMTVFGFYLRLEDREKRKVSMMKQNFKSILYLFICTNVLTWFLIRGYHLSFVFLGETSVIKTSY